MTIYLPTMVVIIFTYIQGGFVTNKIKTFVHLGMSILPLSILPFIGSMATFYLLFFLYFLLSTVSEK